MKISRRCCWWLTPCGIQCCVDLKRHQRFTLYYRLHLLDQAAQELDCLDHHMKAWPWRQRTTILRKVGNCLGLDTYSTLLRFWLVGNSAELADGPMGAAKGAWGATSVWKEQLSLRRRWGVDQIWRCISDSLLAYRSKIPPAKNRALHCNVPKICNVEIERSIVGNRVSRTVENTRQSCI
jgi:hypothetical protein